MGYRFLIARIAFLIRLPGGNGFDLRQASPSQGGLAQA